MQPDEVITDDSSLYPAALAKVWPTAAHQLFRFHETRRVTGAAMAIVQAVRRGLPTSPTDDPANPRHQHWQRRQAIRQAGVAAVHELAGQRLSQRAIASQLGLSRRTVRSWLQLPPPTAVTAELATIWRQLRLPDWAARRRERRVARWAAVQALAEAGCSYSAIARQVGLHRVTVSAWLQHGPPAWDGAADVAPPPGAEVGLAPSATPASWASWAEVRRARAALTAQRFLLMRRPEHMNAELQADVAALLTSPAGPDL